MIQRKITRTTSLFLFLLPPVVLLSLIASGCAPSNLIIKKTAAFEQGIDVQENIRKECELEERLPLVVQKVARRYYSEVTLQDQIPASTPDQVLTMKITDVIAEKRHGVLSGRKSIVAEGVLTQNGKVIGTFTDLRQSGGAMLTGPRGECYLLNHSAKAIAKDVGIWLANPRMNSMLGKAKRRKKHVEAHVEEHVEEEEVAEEPDSSGTDEN